MGNLLSTKTSEKETTSRKKEYESSFSNRRYNMGPTISVAGPRLEKKELPKTSQVTTQRSPRVLREHTTLDSYWDDVLAKASKQQEKISRESEYASSFSYRKYNTGQTVLVNSRLEKKELPKTSQVTTQRVRSPKVLRESTTLDSYWDDLLAKTSKQQEKYNTGQTVFVNARLEKKELPKTNPTLDSYWDDILAKTSKQQEKISEVKENKASLPHRSYNTAVKYDRKPTSRMKNNDVSLPEDFGNLTDSNREDVKKITEIVRHILRNYDQFEGVYGNWSCRRFSTCNNEDEWQILFNEVSLQSYLQLTPEKKHNFFKRSCKKCGKESSISSFFLCKQRPTYLEDAVEVICHLEWNNHYRVFANWECQRPQHGNSIQHKWGSSYTWISLQKFIEQASVNDFSRKDFYKQKCHECRENCSNCKNKPKKYRGCVKCNYEGAITNYGCLKLSGGGTPHKRWLCAKCREGAICVRTDDNRRPIRRNRKILLY